MDEVRRATTSVGGPARRALAGKGALLLIASLLIAAGSSGCGPDVLAERSGVVAGVQEVPTFTPLPPPSPTLTALPSATPVAPYATPTPSRFQRAGLPVRLEIPAIDVDAEVEKVGRDSEGQVDVPKISANVAWFTESALPGMDGKTSIISGHLDDPYGPAVFYNLRRLVPGDELVVTYSGGDRFVFTVVEKERYEYDAAPAQKIFGATPQRTLNLITCDGAWNAGEANYQQRLVVYTRFKGALGEPPTDG